MPIAKVRLPDGRIGRFEVPEGTTPEQVLEFARAGLQAPQEAQQPAQGPSFLADVAQAARTRGGQVEETFGALKRGEIDPITAGIQAVGKGGAGLAVDVIGAGLQAGARGISALIPDVIEKRGDEAIVSGFKALAETSIGQFGIKAFKAGGRAYDAFKSRFPQEAKTIEAIANIAIIATPPKPSPRGAAPLQAGARFLERKAASSEAKKRSTFVSKLISPKKTAKVAEEEVATSIEKGVGLARRTIVRLTKRQAEVAAEVMKIKNVSQNRTVVGNFNVIKKENVRLAKSLEKEVGKSKSILRTSTVEDAINASIKVLRDESAVLTSEKALVNTTNNIVRNAKRILAKHEQTPLGALRARKEFDQWIGTQKPKAFEQNTQNAFELTKSAVRDAMNASVAKAVRKGVVEKELRKQSNLFVAMDNMTPKVAAQKNNVLTRKLEEIKEIVQAKSLAVGTGSALLGLGVLGASQVVNPIFSQALIGAVVVGGVGKFVMSPSSRRAVAKLLRAMDIITGASTDAALIRKWRLDRVAIVEILKSTETQKEGQ